MSITINVSKTQKDWVEHTCQGIIDASQEAISARGKFTLVLSGGSTPAPIYQALGRSALDWANIYLFWGDERCVPPQHPESNYNLVEETLLEHITIPPENIFRIRGEEEPATAAKIYQNEIEKFFQGQKLRFDLVLLGLGGDGHTASLFPGTPALNENLTWVVENYQPETNLSRITLTYPAILSARQIFFLVQGGKKAPVVKEVLENPEGAPHYPAKEIKNASGNIVWYLDEAAAKEL